MTGKERWVSIEECLERFSAKEGDGFDGVVERFWEGVIKGPLPDDLKGRLGNLGRGAEPKANPHNLGDIRRTRDEYEGNLSGGTPKKPLQIPGLISQKAETEV